MQAMNIDDFPNLAGVATKDLVETKGGSFRASYINWSRTLQLLREHAPGWMVSADLAPDGGIVFESPGKGGYLMMRLVHINGSITPASPQSIMDNRNQSIPVGQITSRDVTDTHRRGACMIVAMHFGLAYELWAKDELESGYADGSAEKDRFSPTAHELVNRVNTKRSSDAAQKINSTAPESNGSPPMTSAEKLAKAMEDKQPDPDRPIGNVFEAIERIKNCKTEKGARKSMEDSIWKYRFSMNDRGQMENAVEYQVSLINKKGN